MGCKCCRWPVNACRMARMVKLLPLSFGALVLFLAVHSFYNYSIVTGALLLILGLTPPRRTPLKLPPGPSGLPVVGYLPFVGALSHQHMAILARKFEPLVHLQLGSIPGFAVASARLAKEVLMTQDRVFASRPDSFVTWAKLFVFDNKDSGVQTSKNSMSTARPGPFLTEMRSLVAVELNMVPKRKEYFKSIRSEEMDAMEQGLLEDVKLGKQVVMNVMTRMVIQKRSHAKDISAETKREAFEFQKLLGAVLTRAGHSFRQDFITWLRSVMSLTTEWELADLLHHPAIQKKLQAEPDAKFNTARMAQEGNLGNQAHGFQWSLTNGVAPEDMDMVKGFGQNLQLKSPLCHVCCEARLPLEAYRC